MAIQDRLYIRLTVGPPMLCGSKEVFLVEYLASAQHKVDRPAQFGRQDRKPISGEHCPSCRPENPGTFRPTISAPSPGGHSLQTEPPREYRRQIYVSTASRL